MLKGGLVLLLVVANLDIVSWLCERVPWNVEPAVSGEQLVGIGIVPKAIHQMLELLRVTGMYVVSLPKKVLWVADAAYPSGPILFFTVILINYQRANIYILFLISKFPRDIY